MLRSFGLLRAVLRRARADWPIVAAAWLLLLCATTLIAASAVYGDAVADGGLRRALADAPPVDRTVVVRMSRSAAEVAELDPVVAREATAAISSVGGEVALVAQSSALEAPDATPSAGEPPEGTPLASFEGIERHATLVAGAWPVAGRSPVQATVSDGAAEALGVQPGDRLSLVASLGADLTVEVEIVGIWRPTADDPYWLGDVLELQGRDPRASFVATGPVVVTIDDLVALLGRGTLDLQWRAIPDADGLRADRVAALREGVGGLRERLGAVLPARTGVTIATTIPQTLDGLGRSILVSRSGIVLLTIQFAVLAVYAILLVAGMLLERRRPEIALLRSRGASTGHLAAMAIAEGLVLAVPTILLAPFLAIGVVHLLGTTGPLAGTGILTTGGVTVGVVLAASAAALGCVVVLAVPSLAGGGPLAGVRAAIGRQTNRTMAQRLGLDLVLVVVAAIALWQLRLYGAPLTRQAQGALGVDPLLVAAPAIGLLAGGVLATRIVPRIGELAERLFAGRRGLVAGLGARQLARRPLRYTRSAMLILLATALGTFAAADAATWGRSQADRATYLAATDLRVASRGSADLPSWADAAGYRAIDGVTAALPVLVEPFDVGRSLRNATLLALDPDAAARVTTAARSDGGATVPELLGQLAAARPPAASVEVPGRPRRFAITIDARLRDDAPDDDGIEYVWPGLGTGLVVQDADGLIHRVTGERATRDGGEQRLEVPLDAALDGTHLAPAWPLRLVAVELEVRGPGFVPVVGTVELLRVEASDAPAGGAWRPVPFAAGGAGIAWERAESTQVQRYRPPAGAPGRIVFGTGAGSTPPIVDAPGSPVTVMRLEAQPPREAAIPAIVGARFLEATGTAVGDTLDISLTGDRFPVRIVASTELFPPLDPGAPFAVLDAATLEATRFERLAFAGDGDEWWLAVEPGRSAGVADVVGREPFRATDVIARDALAQRFVSDPVTLGVIGALGLGAAAALAFAAIGFVVSAAVSAGERIGEFALLQALGLSTRELSRWLSVENAFLLLFGVLGGTALGVLLAQLVLPFSTLTETGDRVVPPPVVVVPWGSLAPVYALAAGLLVVAIAIAIRQLPRIRISSVLRGRDE